MTTLSQQAHEAGRIIHRCWTNGEAIEMLPDGCRPGTVAQGYEAQRALAAATGEAVVGWKIAATSVSGQRHINVEGPIAGRLLANRVHHSPCAVPFGANRMAVAEAEFAFVIGADLPAREHDYPVDEVLAAVATLHPAIELPDSRFADFTRAGIAQLAADNACAHEFVLGPATGADWRAIDLAASRSRCRSTTGWRRPVPAPTHSETPASHSRGSRTTTPRRGRHCAPATSSPPGSAASRAPSPREAAWSRTSGSSAPPR